MQIFPFGGIAPIPVVLALLSLFRHSKKNFITVIAVTS